MNKAVTRPVAASLALAGVTLASLSGCATRADMDQLRKSQRQVRQVVADQTLALDDVRRRLDRLQASMDEGGAPRPTASGASLSTIEARLSALERRVAEAAVPPPVDPNAMPAAATPPGAAVPPPSAAAPGTTAPGSVVPIPPPAPAAQTGSPLGELQAAATRENTTAGEPAFQAAMAQVRQGRCKEAVPALREFVRTNIKSPQADDAQYWIGRCFYAQGDQNTAMKELYDVLLKFPKSEKVPAALLVLADVFAASGDDIDARLTLNKLISDHPNAPEVQAAKQKLQALGD